MSMFTSVLSVLYIISTSLLYPVIFMLIGILSWSLLNFGMFLSEWTTRYRNPEEIESMVIKSAEMFGNGNVNDAVSLLKNMKGNQMLKKFLIDLSDAIEKNTLSLKLDKLYEDYEIKISKSVEKTKIGAKIGPMLGLMGTLIPMGPALSGLLSGNVEQMVNNLIMAFSTTVLGLSIAVILYTITVVRGRWYAQDLSDIDYILRIFEEVIHEKEKWQEKESRVG